MATFRVIGRPVPRLEGVEKVTGSARYVADMALPGLLWGRVLRSPYPHARLLRVDASRARQVPGVHAVLTGEDVPEVRVGRRLRDLPVLARGVVRFVGEKVAAVAAETPEAAQAALDLIEVEYEELPAVFDPEEAMAEGAPVLHPDLNTYHGLPEPKPGPTNVVSHVTFAKGDVEEGFRQADEVLEHTFTLPRVHQAYLEPHACVVWLDPEGRVQVWANNKTPYQLRGFVAAAAGVPEERVRVNPVPIGGDFGGKGSPMDVPLAYFLARATGRPVKMVMGYLEEFLAGNPRHPARVTVRSGVRRDGTLTARQVRVVFNSGAYAAFKPSPHVNLFGAMRACGPYRIPHARIDAFMVYTNTVPCGHFRAPGDPQVVFAVESHTDMVARALGMDPYEFRLRNLVREGDEGPVGQRWREVRAEEVLRRAAQAIGWGEPRPAPYVGRGLAVHERGTGTGHSAAAVVLEADGSVTVRTAVLEQGAGVHLVLRQVAAEELGVPVERGRVLPEDTDFATFDSGIGGSRGTNVPGQAVLRAAQELRRQAAALAAEVTGWPEEGVRFADGAGACGDATLPLAEVARRALELRGTPLSARAEYAAAEAGGVTAFMAQAAEVEVDPETGQVRVRRFVTVHDAGRVLSPVAFRGQVEGGVVQGLGYALMEELQEEEGRVTTLSFGEVKVPTIRDIPPLTTIVLEAEGGPAPYQAKAIGEMSNCPVAAAVANAVEDAVGVRVTALPLTAERVYRELRRRPE